MLLFYDPSNRIALQRKAPVVIHPEPQTKAVIAIDKSSPYSAAYRGRLEIALSRASMRLVNIVDLENYTHGVVSVEMPIQSPLEALKAQAVLARSHAIYLKKVAHRHRKQGYDLCDEQHCQVYAGARAESPRSRQVVDSTRGKVVTYKGRIAYMIYCSNCGGHTQSGADLTGWGEIPYWKGIPDSAESPDRLRSPWELRQWLMSWPQAYCQASSYVHPSHFRWHRVIPWTDLEEKINRKYKVGRLLALRTLRRSPAGNVNSLLIAGSRRSARVRSEIDIRGLLGLGSLRSTLFVMETEFADGKPKAAVFHGGGWGHGVGLCQSGAMGRAEAGQDYAEIIRAYFPGTELGSMLY